MELPFIPIVTVMIGGGAGYLLDRRLHTMPLFTLILGLVGFAAGIREILRRVGKEEKGNGEE